MGNGVNGSLDVLLSKMEDFVTTKTVVGEAIEAGGVTILPLIEVSVGVGAGGSEGKDKNIGGGMGAKIIPSAVLVITNGTVQLINIKNQDAVSKLIDMAPGVVSKLNFGAVFGNGVKKKEEPEVKFEEEVVTEKDLEK